jgi:hypothetical protein
MKPFATKQSEPCGNEKLDYRTPSLKNYGALAELTQGGTELGNDGNTECTGNSDSATSPCTS